MIRNMSGMMVVSTADSRSVQPGQRHKFAVMRQRPPESRALQLHQDRRAINVINQGNHGSTTATSGHPNAHVRARDSEVRSTSQAGHEGSIPFARSDV